MKPQRTDNWTLPPIYDPPKVYQHADIDAPLDNPRPFSLCNKCNRILLPLEGCDCLPERHRKSDLLPVAFLALSAFFMGAILALIFI